MKHKNNNKNTTTSFLIIVVVVVAGFLLINRASLNKKPETALLANEEAAISKVVIGGKTIKVDVADTPSTQAAGLSLREKLNENEGMLFVFDKTGKYPFWMKDMKFAIDIIWINEAKRVVSIEKNALPESYPKVLGGREDAKYVLEVNAGFSEMNKVKVGDAVQF